VSSGDSHSTPAERAAVVDSFEEHGVEIPAVAAGDELAVADDDERAAQVASAKANVELAGDLGAGVVRVFAGGDREEMTGAAAADTAAVLTELGDLGADHGVTPVLETMHDIVQSPADARAVLDRVETDNVGVLWNRASIDAREFEAIREAVRHVHVHDEVLDPEYEPIADLIERFDGAGYDGYVSLEIIRGEDLPTGVLRETGERLRDHVEGMA